MLIQVGFNCFQKISTKSKMVLLSNFNIIDPRKETCNIMFHVDLKYGIIKSKQNFQKKEKSETYGYILQSSST